MSVFTFHINTSEPILNHQRGPQRMKQPLNGQTRDNVLEDKETLNENRNNESVDFKKNVSVNDTQQFMKACFLLKKSIQKVYIRSKAIRVCTETPVSQRFLLST